MPIPIGNPCYPMSAATEPSHADRRRAFELAGEIAASRDAAGFAERLDGLPELIGADAMMVSVCRAWGTDLALELGDPGLFRPELLEAVVACRDEHPVMARDLARADTATRRISDFVAARDWHRRRLFNDFYRRVGLSHELSTQLAWGPAGASCCMTLHRAGRDFSERDRALVDLLAPHLRSARARLEAEGRAARRLAQVEAAGDALGGGTLLIGRDGDLVTTSPGARELLGRWFAADEDRLPAELLDWRRAARAGGAPRPLLTRECGGARLRVELLAGEEEDVVLLREHPATPSPTRLAAALPITGREAEVLALLAAGHTNDGIAQALRISRHTVVRHVEHVYRKLGVQTRVAATRVALDAQARG